MVNVERHEMIDLPGNAKSDPEWNHSGTTSQHSDTKDHVAL